jgi:response regulator of citrate/malate metabolism
MSRRPDVDLARWCAALSAEVVTDEVPPGWLTAAELATKLNKSTSTMGKLLLAAVRAGKCDTAKFRVQVGSLVRPTPHYRLK